MLSATSSGHEHEHKDSDAVNQLWRLATLLEAHSHLFLRNRVSERSQTLASWFSARRAENTDTRHTLIVLRIVVQAGPRILHAGIHLMLRFVVGHFSWFVNLD